MLDIKYVVANAEAVAQNIKNRFAHGDVPALLEVYQLRNQVLTQLEQLRYLANLIAKQTGKPELDDSALHALIPSWLLQPLAISSSSDCKAKDRAWLVGIGKQLKLLVPDLEKQVAEIEARQEVLARQLPNMTHPDVPLGATDDDHRVLRLVGTPRQFEFVPVDHVVLSEQLGLVDFEAGAKVAGQKFYFLKNQMVILDLALQRFAIDVLIRKGFTPVVTPDLAKPSILEGIGFNPRGAETQVYSVANHDLCLVGTAEITIGGMLAGQILDPGQLPVKIAGISHCFRTEAGSAGRESRGLYRVHQFTKVEMFVFCEGDTAVSDVQHEELLAIEEEIFQALEVPYRVLDIAAGDLGAPAYRKFDIEAWMPGRGAYGEVTSTSNCTDFQARRLDIRYRTEEGARPRFVHTLNGTAIALSRGLIAVLENHQQADGSVTMPKALLPYLPWDRIGPVAKP